MNAPRDNGRRHHWKLWFVVPFLAVTVPLMIGDLIGDIAQAVEYYGDAPGMLLVALAIAGAVGMVVAAAWYMARRLPRRLQRQLVLWGWASGNVLLLCLAAWLGSASVRFIMWEHEPFGRLIAENAGSTGLKYVLGANALLLLAATSVSCLRLVRFSKTSANGI